MDFLKKFKGLLLDATVGLVKQYQSKSIDLVKLEAAACYVRGVQLLRRQVFLLTVVLFLVVTAAVGVLTSYRRPSSNPIASRPLREREEWRGD